jgi:hypothetical protein
MGFPLDVAMELEYYERLALIIIDGELEGGTFNWDNMEWEKDDDAQSPSVCG